MNRQLSPVPQVAGFPSWFPEFWRSSDILELTGHLFSHFLAKCRNSKVSSKWSKELFAPKRRHDDLRCDFSEGQMGQGALSGPRPGLGRVSVALQGAVICSHRSRAAQVTSIQFYTFRSPISMPDHHGSSLTMSRIPLLNILGKNWCWRGPRSRTTTRDGTG